MMIMFGSTVGKIEFKKEKDEKIDGLYMYRIENYDKGTIDKLKEHKEKSTNEQDKNQEDFDR